jgi:signal transduction histidine kinase
LRLASQGQEKSEIERLLSEQTKADMAASQLSAFHRQGRDWHILGLRYRRTPYAFIAAAGRDNWSSQDIEAGTSMVELAFLAFQNRIAHNALNANERPLDVTLDDELFYDELRRFIVEATGMQLVILRIRGEPGTPDGKNLHGIVVNGWDEPPNKFDLLDYSRFPTFNRAVTAGLPLFMPDPDDEEVQAIWREHPHLRIFESFALFPIENDQQYVSAVLTIGSTCHLDFIPVLEAIIKGVAHTVGFTLRNRDLHYQRAELQSSAIETASALNAVELYSDLTHQMGNALAAIPEVLEAIESAGKKGKQIPLGELLGPKYLKTVEDSHDQISTLIEQATAVTSPKEDDLQRVYISDVWNEAVSLVNYRLHRYGIAVTRKGDILIEAYRLQLRQVFFHLLLNSIDAFAARSRRPPPRDIELHVYPPNNSTSRCVIRYIDNAGGINPARLRRRGDRGSTEALPPLEQAIFVRGVTSRKDGSGNGLWVVRQILQRHYGGINLVSYREGIVFDIELPVNLSDEVSRRGRSV